MTAIFFCMIFGGLNILNMLVLDFFFIPRKPFCSFEIVDTFF